MKPGAHISLERNITAVMRSLRETYHYSQEYVAAELGINQNTYSKLESGQTQITIKRLEQLSKVYKVALTDFFKDPEPSASTALPVKRIHHKIESGKMTTLLQILRTHYNFDIARIATELKITEAEYHQLENGNLKLTFRQAIILADLYNIEPSHLLATNNPVINYNIGPKSRGITNVNHYYEDSSKSNEIAAKITHHVSNSEGHPSQNDGG